MWFPKFSFEMQFVEGWNSLYVPNFFVVYFQVGEIFMYFSFEQFFFCFFLNFHLKWKFAPFLTRLCYQSRVWRNPNIYNTPSYLCFFYQGNYSNPTK